MKKISALEDMAEQVTMKQGDLGDYFRCSRPSSHNFLINDALP
jgi:hypothetical protein